MELEDAKRKALSLMAVHGLAHVPFEFGSTKRMLGAMYFTPGTYAPLRLMLSRHAVLAMPEDEITEIILHEIAHGLAGYEAGHGSKWKTICRSIGGNPNRCHEGTPIPGKYQLKCKNGHVVQMHRRLQRIKSCSLCTGGRFDRAHLMRFYEGDREVPLEEMPVSYQNEWRRNVTTVDMSGWTISRVR